MAGGLGMFALRIVMLLGILATFAGAEDAQAVEPGQPLVVVVVGITDPSALLWSSTPQKKF